MNSSNKSNTRISVDAVCEAFELEWQQKRVPAVESFLLSAPPAMQTELLEELACTDLEWRYRNDADPKIERYLGLAMEVSDRRNLLLTLIKHEIPIRRRAGEEVRIYEYFQRFPQFISGIRDAFPMLLSGSLLEHPTILDEESPTLIGTASLQSMVHARIMETIAPVAETVYYEPGDYVIREGATDQDVYFIEQGTTHAVLRDATADGLILGEPGAGDIVGEMALLTTEPRMLDIVAATRVRAQKVSSAAFHKLAAKFPELAGFMTDIVAERLGRSDRDALSGKVLCGHRIERLLGRGANGIVYAARHVETNDRVALKMMSHRLTCLPRAKQLFRQEASTPPLITGTPFHASRHRCA